MLRYAASLVPNNACRFQTHSPPPPPTDGHRASMEAELKELLKQQRRALELAVYVGMGASDAQEYEHRARRITELQIALGVQPEFTIGLW